ncbi:MAG: hypothetical protein M1827_000925 [Pycnora praestabilis]|nr:MAG: hypothetical protein M1827_000925 [Pycnora praestabilis]
MPHDISGVNGADNGLGSLADELAEAWDEDEEEEDGNGAWDPPTSGLQDACRSDSETFLQYPTGNAHDGTTITSPPLPKRPIENNSQEILKESTHSGRRRKHSHHERLDYDSNSELEDCVTTSGLEMQMSAVERIAWTGNAMLAEEGSNVIGRVVDILKIMGGQAGVEAGTTRLITAHTALSTHLAYQTRTLQTLTFSLLSPLSLPPDPELIEDMLPLITAAASLIPRVSPLALTTLHHLSQSTTDLIQNLNYLSDSLHMSRQTTTLATRRLRSAKELVMELRRDTETRTEGVRWIEKGEWQNRLQKRECAGVCGDVVSGFEEVCQVWRDRLVAGLEVGAA